MSNTDRSTQLLQNLVIALDGSGEAESAIPFGVYLASELGLRTHLIRVIQTESPVVLTTASNFHWESLMKLLHEQSTAYLRQVAGNITSTGLEVMIRLVEGYPADQIVRYAESLQGGIIVITSHGYSGAESTFFGGTTDNVLRRATRPVIVIPSNNDRRASSSPRIDRLIVPVDGSKDAEAVLPHAGFFSRQLSAKTVLTTVLSKPLFSWATSSLGERESEDEPRAKNAASDYLNSTAERLKTLGATDVETVVSSGDPSENIIDLAGNESNSLVALTSRGIKASGKWWIGSVTSRVVRHAACPVYMVPVRR